MVDLSWLLLFLGQHLTIGYKAIFILWCPQLNFHPFWLDGQIRANLQNKYIYKHLKIKYVVRGRLNTINKNKIEKRHNLIYKFHKTHMSRAQIKRLSEIIFSLFLTLLLVFFRRVLYIFFVRKYFFCFVHRTKGCGIDRSYPFIIK